MIKNNRLNKAWNKYNFNTMSLTLQLPNWKRRTKAKKQRKKPNLRMLKTNSLNNQMKTTSNSYRAYTKWYKITARKSVTNSSYSKPPKLTKSWTKK